MRVLLIGRHHDERIRGAAVGLHGLARALRDSGDEVTLVHSARPEHRLSIDGIEILYHRSTRKSLYPLLFATRRLGGFDVIHAHDESGAYLALRSRLERLPLVAHLNAPRVKDEGWWRASWRWRYIGIAARLAPVIVTPSLWLAGEIARRYGRSPRDIVSVPIGVGDHWFEAFRKLGGPAGGEPVRIVLVNMKGVEDALHAFARLPPALQASLEVYGTHKHIERYLALAAELGIEERVHFMGFVQNAELPGRLAGADVLLHATPSESFGQVLAEAAALGIPAVTTRVTAVPEVVEDGVTGLLCPPGDLGALSAALERVVGDPDLRAHLGGAARSRAELSWRWPVVARRMLDEVYLPLLARLR